MVGSIEPGREAFARQAWADAYRLLAGGEAQEGEDLERLAVAAHLVGEDDESARAWEQAHHAHVRRGDRERAARCAFWLALGLLLRGDVAQGGGWLTRAERLVADDTRESVAAGLIRVPMVLEALEGGDAKRAYELAGEVVDLARRLGDPDLLALAVLGRGQASLALGETGRGLKLLDEVMVSVTTGEVAPIPAGIVYCAVIEACMDVFDLRRAAEWTEALHGWCAAQPDLVPYSGQCLVHRSQVLQAHGSWSDAAAEAEQARRRLSDPIHPAVGLAFYQQGELHRLRGEHAAAEQAYRAASRHGREPAPGFALLRLAEGNVEAAVVAIRRMVDESRGRLARPTMLAAAVEVLLAAGDVGAARAAADELGDIAGRIDVPLLHAVSQCATGTVLLAEGDVAAALTALRRADQGWRSLGMPFDAARARVQLAGAYRALGDHDAADLELDAARAVFEQLDAAPELARLAQVTGAATARPTALTGRECEVLKLVAAGKSNRQIAADLVISEHTVARHLQNIFAKLGLSSRAAATGYAYEHGLA
ncbi:MAG TPA: helix-turn-helix transcriptional regulator [Acidimicrobiales bacterium]|nr:helix-turn-helix transcriptional regulator [Acidimicrobiales bacterium]